VFTFIPGGFSTNDLLLNVSSGGPAVAPPILSGTILSNGVLQFSFTDVAGASFTMLAPTNFSLPISNWTVLGPFTENPPGQYNFADDTTTNGPMRFYRVRSP
jgi:hypothetical protein